MGTTTKIVPDTDWLDPPSAVYVLFGDDEVSKDEGIQRIIKRFVEPGFEDYDCQVMDAESVSALDIAAAANQAAFGSERRVVLVRGAELFRKRERTAEAVRLADGIDRLSGGCCLILRVASLDEERSRAKTPFTGKLETSVTKRGKCVAFLPLSEEQLSRLVHNDVQSTGKRITPPAVHRLVAACKGNRLALKQEVAKVIALVGDSPLVDESAVNSVISNDPEDVMFRLLDAIGRRQSDKAITLIHEMSRFESKPQAMAGRLLTLIQRQLKLLWQASELQQLNVSPSSLKSLPVNISNDLPKDASIASLHWKASDLFASARLWSRSELAAAMESVALCDLSNKGGEEGSEDVTSNIVLLTHALCSSSKRAGKNVER